MKLKLSSESDIQILSAQGPIDLHEVQVLKAGVTQLFKKGKNRIILELHNMQSLESQVVREIAILNNIARELSGEIVIAGVGMELQAKIELFSTPPIVSCFRDRTAALHALRERARKEQEKPFQVDQSTQNLNWDSLKSELLALKQSLRDKEASVLGPLRKENAKLKEQNELLRQQVVQLTYERRLPTDPKSYDEKVRVLEKKLEQALNTIKELKDPVH